MSREERYHTKRIGHTRYPPLAKGALDTIKMHPTLDKYRNAIDLGSSCGPFLLELVKLQPDLKVTGLDISDYAGKHWCVPEESGNFIQADFNESCLDKTDETYDLITCTEVAEHVVNGDHLLDFMDKISTDDSILIFGAAHPKQKARGHINCHWHRWWMNELEKRGWLYNHHMTTYFCHEIGRANHGRKEQVPLYYLNSMVFQKSADPESEDGLRH